MNYGILNLIVGSIRSVIWISEFESAVFEKPLSKTQETILLIGTDVDFSKPHILSL